MTSPFSPSPQQHGIVVPDLGSAIAEWTAKGIGPFLVMRKVVLADYVYGGRRSKPRLDVAFSQDGDVQIELIQPTNDEPSSYRDFLAQGGNGLHHHGWFCEDFEGAVAQAGREGRAELQRGKWGSLHFVYYHAPADDDVIAELIEMSDLSRELFALIRETAENWDGTRPARNLLREAGWGLRWTAARVQLGALLGR